MSFPTLAASAADALVDNLLEDEKDDQWAQFVVLADGPDFDQGRIEQAAREHELEWSAEEADLRAQGETADQFLLEAFMASRIHKLLHEIPVEILQNMGFWRYLALFPYRWYLQLREGGASGLDLKPQDYGGRNTSKDGKEQSTGPKYQLILRTFLWGKAAYDPDEPGHYRRATLVNETGGAVADVWHSHIVRVQLGHLGRLPHAFLDSICEPPVANSAHKEKGARPVEKRLTRMKHTVLFDVYDLDEVRELVDTEKSAVLDS